jgi:WD40 repeat protein
LAFLAVLPAAFAGQQAGKEDPLPDGAVTRLGTLRFRHAGDAEELAYSPDGKMIASFMPEGAPRNRGICLFDADSGKLILHIGPNRQYRRIAFSPSGNQLACYRDGDSKGVVEIWDLVARRIVKEYESEPPLCLEWMAEGKPLAIVPTDTELRLCELASGIVRRVKAGFPIISLAIHFRICASAANGKVLALASAFSGEITVWVAADGGKRRTLKTERDRVKNLALSRDGRWLASYVPYSDRNDLVQIWDVTTGKLVHNLVADPAHLATVEFAPDGKTLATVGYTEIGFRDVASGQKRGQIKGHEYFARSLAFSPDGKTLATGERFSAAIHRWDVASGAMKPERTGHANQPVEIAISPADLIIASRTREEDGVFIWDSRTGDVLLQVGKGKYLTACTFSRDGKSLFVCGGDQRLQQVDVHSGTLLEEFSINASYPFVRNAHGNEQTEDHAVELALSLSADGKSLVAVSKHLSIDHATAIRKDYLLVSGWDIAMRKRLFRRRRPTINLGAAVSNDLNALAVPLDGAKGDGPMMVEDLSTGKPIVTFPGVKGVAKPLGFSRDGRLLLSHHSLPGDDAETFRVWELITSSEVLALPTVSEAAAFSPDSRLLAVPSPGQQILLWDLRRGRELRRFANFGADVTSLAFSADGNQLVSGLADSTLLVWDIAPVRKILERSVLDATTAERAWADLKADPPRAFLARCALAESPNVAVSVLKQHLVPASAPDDERISHLITDLDSKTFATRSAAQEELKQLGNLAKEPIRRTLKERPSLEMRTRLEFILKNLSGPDMRPEKMQLVRAVAVLEEVATPEARRILERLASGEPRARVTREATAALGRLSRKPTRTP